MLTTWEEINALTRSDDDFRVTITLGYGSISIIVMYGDDFRYANLREIDHKYDIEEAIKNTIERFKQDLKEEH